MPAGAVVNLPRGSADRLGASVRRIRGPIRKWTMITSTIVVSRMQSAEPTAKRVTIFLFSASERLVSSNR